jgi:acetylornithine deacetylase/succinyl-diaminopimelate desuccinylase-like protein
MPGSRGRKSCPRRWYWVFAGLGPIGGNDHAPGEYLDVDSIVPRTTMFAGILLAVARDPEVLAWRDGPG